jgi:enoyl-CoA hydratase
MHPHLAVEKKGRLLCVTFQRPDDCNVSDSMAEALSYVLLDAHVEADAVLLTSQGLDFCTGRTRDVPGAAEAEAYVRRNEYDAIFGSYRAVRSCQVPVVAVIRGKAMGYGAAIAALCDVSFAAATATFNIPEIEHNVMPTMVMSAIADRVSRNAALWMAYSADFIDSQRALTYGFISHVVSDEKLDEEVERFCRTLLSRPRPAILGLKEYLRVAPRMDEQGATDFARSIHSMVNAYSGMRRKG